MSHGPLDPAQDAEIVTQRILKLVRESDGQDFDTMDADGTLAHHCPPMSVRERRANPRPESGGVLGALQREARIDSANRAANVAPRIPRQRGGINLGKLLAVLGVMVGGAALLVGVVVWYVAIGFRMLP